MCNLKAGDEIYRPRGFHTSIVGLWLVATSGLRKVDKTVLGICLAVTYMYAWMSKMALFRYILFCVY